MNIIKTLNKHKSVEDLAAIWFLHLSEPDCSKRDRAAFEQWRSTAPAHAEAYDRIERSLVFADRHSSHPLLADLMDEILAETEPEKTKKGWFVASVALAGTVMIAVMVYMFIPLGISGIVVHDTIIGERSTIALSDGSTVILNTNSRIEVEYTDDQRSLTLLRGQAIFEVAKNKNWPFVVEAGNQRITALGTSFDVRLDQELEAVKIVLVEGRVAVDEFLLIGPKSQQKAIPSKRIELNVGERLIASAGVPRTAVKINLDKAISWKSGKVIFREEFLTQAVREVNRYSTENIRLADDPRVRNLRVSGIFNTGQVKSFVYVLESTHNLTAQRTSKNEITLIWHEQ